MILTRARFTRGFQARVSRCSIKIGDPAAAGALAREHSDFDFRLIEPASVSGRVVHGEAISDVRADLAAGQVSQGLTPMDVEIIQNQVDGFGCRVPGASSAGHLGELESGSVRRGEGEVAAGLWLHGAENAGGAAALLFVVLSGLAARFGR